jgi:cytochrome P450
MVPTVMAQVCKHEAHWYAVNPGCAAAQESMRLRPVVAGGMLRVVARDVRLSNGLVLPRGATITGSNLAVLNNPHSWEAPERFMPVRPHARPLFAVLADA